MSESVSLTTDDEGVATLRLDRPPVNALDSGMWEGIGEAAATCAGDDSIRAVVVWGGPKVFAAGADVKEFSGLDSEHMRARGETLQDALRALERAPQIVIAAIDGYALGGGCEVALAADFRFASEQAKLGLPEILLGIIPGAGGTQRLTRLVGKQRAKEMIFSGDMVTAEEALAIGLVDRVTGPEAAYEEALAAARRYARGPYALRMAKRAINEGASMDLDAGLRLETALFAETFDTEDADTGLRSFAEQGPGKARFSYR